MESLLGNDKYFEFNPEINWESVKIRKNRFNITELGQKSNNTSSCVLHTLSCLITCLGKPYSNELQ